MRAALLGGRKPTYKNPFVGRPLALKTAVSALGPGTGTAVVVSASSAQVAAELAGVTRLVVTAGPADQRLAGALAERAPLREMERDDLAGVLRWQDDDEFTIIAGRQVRPGVRWVPAAWEQR